MDRLLAALEGVLQRRTILAAVAAVGMVLAILGMTNLTSRSDLALLYSGLEPAAAGEVMAELDARGLKYEVRGQAIYVAPAERDSLRMSLAAKGLPSMDSEGYEILDALTGFGTTSQMFDAAYWRAKEGELARTLLASPGIRAVRVHISAVSGRPFDREFRPSASIALTPGSERISADVARAARYMVAAAVAGLRPEDVAVIDSRSGTVLPHEAETGASASTRAEELRRSVQSLLEARVGIGKALVEVSVETARDSEMIYERRIDPESRIQISSEVFEKSGTSSDSGAADVTVASNLPAGAASETAGQSQSQDVETRERFNFDMSETRREVQRAAGGVSRITVAALVDGIRMTDAAGAQTWQPRSADELEALRELIASAVGFSAARNDVITIKSLEFAPPVPFDSGSEAALASGLPMNLQTMLELAVLAAVALVLALFVLRPALLPRPLPALPETALPRPEPPQPDPATALTGTIDEGPVPDFALPMSFPEMEAAFPAAAGADPVTRLRQLIADRREETVETLRAWMEDAEVGR